MAVTKSGQQCCSQTHSGLLLAKSYKAGFIQNKTSLCVHHSTVWPVSYVTSLVESLPQIRSPLPPFLTLTGTLDRFHKGYNTNSQIKLFPRLRFLVLDASWWTFVNFWTCVATWVFSCEVRVSCDLQLPEYLQQTPAGLTSENAPGGSRPKV